MLNIHKLEAFFYNLEYKEIKELIREYIKKNLRTDKLMLSFQRYVAFSIKKYAGH